MNGIRTATAVALVLGLGAAMPALAEGQKHNQTQTMTPGAASAATSESWYRNLSADDLIGKDVTNTKGDQVAEIDDVVMDPQTRRLYAILAVGGVMGMGQKHIAVPMNDLSLSNNNALLLSLASEQDLKNRPAYVDGQFRSIDGAQSLAEVPN